MDGDKRLVFDWDDANISHISRHGITPEEAEEVLVGASIELASGECAREERHAELGETARGRLLVVVWTWRRGKVRVVTAFQAKRKLRAFYRQVRKGEKHE